MVSNGVMVFINEAMQEGASGQWCGRIASRSGTANTDNRGMRCAGGTHLMVGSFEFRSLRLRVPCLPILPYFPPFSKAFPG